MEQQNRQQEGVPFEDLADRFTNEIRKGENPSIDSFAEHHPDHATAIRRLFPVLQAMEHRGTPVEDLSESGLLAAEKQQLDSEPQIRKLGDYRIVREIGRGGMGVVFEAEQQSLGRRVALKLLPDSAQFDDRRQQRFQQEAQASAKLQHPNIVNVFGVGSQDGTSYFVMQFIDGQPLNNVLKEVSRIRTGGLDSTLAIANAEVGTIVSSLQNEAADDTAANNNSTGTISGNEVPDANPNNAAWSEDSSSKTWWHSVAGMGVQVASALEHAHNNRILHRDIKPANLMIDSTSNVWVTDFGLAKHFESTDLTRTGEVVGTLRYMSPEQLNGNADERSDIFGLGLTLYEMAALQPAYPASDRSDLMKQALEASPARLRSIDRSIPRDLETVIHKCIAAEPKQRYQTATELKDDLNRLIDGEPVMARRINFVERTIKWARRRPVIASLCTALALSLVAGIAGITWQWQKTEAALETANANLAEAKKQNARADKHFREARESVDKFYTIISEERLLKEPGLQLLRKELMQEAATYYRNFSNQYSDDDSLKLEVGKSLLRLVQIEGLYSTKPELLETCREAGSIFSDLVSINADDAEATLQLAEAYGMESRILGRKKLESSLDPLQKAIGVLEDASERFAEASDFPSRLAAHYQMLALAYEQLDRSTGRTDRSLENFSRAYTLRKELALKHADRTELTLNLADSCRDLGITHRRMGKNKEAIEYYDEAMDLVNSVILRDPGNGQARRMLASVANSVGYFYGNVNSELDLDKAIEMYTISREQYESLARKDPLIIEYQDGLGRAASNLGSIYQQKNDLEKALEYRQESVNIRSRTSAANPTAPHLKSNLALAMSGLGSLLRTLDRLDEATEISTNAMEKHREAVELDPGNPRYKFRLIEGLIQMARVHCSAKRFASARASVDAMEPYLRPDDTRTVAKYAKEYLLIACKIGKLEENERTEEQETLRVEMIARSKKEFEKAAERGLDVLHWYADDTDMRYFDEYSESIEVHTWMKSQFGSEPEDE